MNHFASASAAERYVRGRPYYHALVIERLRRLLNGEAWRALDVGCGTGQSSIALADLAAEVIGIDISREMLNQAQSHPRVRYIEASAESLPLPSGAFDLVTVGAAFHWFDRARFLPDARRVLRAGGALGIYNDGIVGTMTGNDAYAAWNKDQYVRRYPTPPRNSEPFTDEQAHICGFACSAHEEFVHEVVFTPDGLVSYLLTQSNVIAAVEQRGEKVQDIAEWLLASVRALFKGASASFPFFCRLDVFRGELA